jgi:hypothetical protein
VGGQTTYTITGCAGVTIQDLRGTVGQSCYSYSTSSTYAQNACMATGSSRVYSVASPSGDSSLTITPTTGAVTAKINLGNSNAWTASQSITTSSSTPLTLTNNIASSGSTGYGAIVANGPNISNSNGGFFFNIGTAVGTNFDWASYGFINEGSTTANEAWMGINTSTGSVLGICTTASGTIGLGYQPNGTCPITSIPTVANGSFEATGTVYSGGSTSGYAVCTENGTNCPAGSGGSVTSVGLALPSGTFTVSGSPVTTSGTLTAALANQSANAFFAGPSSGSATTPTWRSLVAADVTAAGTLTNATTGNAATATTATNVAGGALGSVHVQTAANTTGFVASPTTTGTYVLGWQPTGSAIAPTALNLNSIGIQPNCNTSSCNAQFNYAFTTSSSLTVNGSVTTSSTTIPVVSTTGFPTNGVATWYNGTTDEAISWTGTTSTSLTGVTRALYGSTAQSGSSGTIAGWMQSNGLSSTTTPYFVYFNNGAITYGSINSSTSSLVWYENSAGVLFQYGITVVAGATFDSSFNAVGPVTFGSTNQMTVSTAGVANVPGGLTAAWLAGETMATFSPGPSGLVGTGATATCATNYVCDEFSGTVNLTTGTGTLTGTGNIVSVNMITRANYPSCTYSMQFVSPPGLFVYGQAVNTSSIDFYNSAALSASTTYYLSYVCGGK